MEFLQETPDESNPKWIWRQEDTLSLILLAVFLLKVVSVTLTTSELCFTDLVARDSGTGFGMFQKKSTWIVDDISVGITSYCICDISGPIWFPCLCGIHNIVGSMHNSVILQSKLRHSWGRHLICLLIIDYQILVTCSSQCYWISCDLPTRTSGSKSVSYFFLLIVTPSYCINQWVSAAGVSLLQWSAFVYLQAV
jgi:hypothetical protein